MTCQEVRQLLPEYVMDWLEAGERARVEEHIRQCLSCAQELRAYQNTAASLALLVPQVEPRPRVKAQMLAGLERRGARAGSPRSALASWWRQGAWWALAVLVLLLVLNNWRLWRQVQALQPPLPTPVAAQETFRLILLYGTQHMPKAKGALLLIPQEPAAVLVVKNLPPPDPGRAYQLWLIRPGGQRVSGAVFSVPDQLNWTVVEVWAPEPIEHFQAFGITLEPEGGSPQPTGPRLLGSR